MEIEIDYTRHYRNWHDGSDADFERMTTGFAGKLTSLVPPNRATRVLEIGCGTGFALGGLQKLGYTAIKGIDSDRGQIAEAHRRNLPAEWVPVKDTAAFLARHCESFDIVLLFDVLEHVPPPDQIGFLRAIREALVPGGSIVVQVPNANAAIASRFRYIDWTHHCSFSEHSLDFVLHNAGFTEIEVREASPNKRPRLAFIPRRSVRRWFMRELFRFMRRLEYAYEDLGWEQAKRLPLSPNIIATAKRQQSRQP
jgi:2-polyprenyl-3-methyl-5-hydroxy-6-metoxy-1,4-benzoquinol methylase